MRRDGGNAFENGDDGANATDGCHAARAVVLVRLRVVVRSVALPERLSEALREPEGVRRNLLPETLDNRLERKDQIFVFHLAHDVEKVGENLRKHRPQHLEVLRLLHKAPNRHERVHAHGELGIAHSRERQVKELQKVVGVLELDVSVRPGDPARLGPDVAVRVTELRHDVLHKQRFERLLVTLGLLELVRQGADREQRPVKLCVVPLLGRGARVRVEDADDKGEERLERLLALICELYDEVGRCGARAVHILHDVVPFSDVLVRILDPQREV
mmetsp:Transcript_22125/g.71628  ORF Transcript_22125/g.71628 Transcript_22125/m.71628 type:complete len:273 (-) Transcript_22125:1097-1915(-)